MPSSKSLKIVLGDSCCQTHTSRTGQVFGALVCDLKDGGAARKVETHFRLQAHKRAFRCQKIQNGPLGKHLPILKKRHVGGKDRPEKCLLSFGVIPLLKRISGVEGGTELLPVSRGSIWPQHPVPNLDDGDEDFLQTLEEERHSVLHLPRRYFGHQPHPWGVQRDL